MKYYVTSDVHGFNTILRSSLDDAGFFTDTGPRKLLILGDLFDRGDEANKLQDFILDLMEKDEVILIRGNHEDLFESLVTEDGGQSLVHHLNNGTYSTALQLTGFTKHIAWLNALRFAQVAKETPYYTRIIPAMRDYLETEHYIFVHGWIPSKKAIDKKDYFVKWLYMNNWREANEDRWKTARWINGIDAAKYCEEPKTVVCGHWHASYGHAYYEGKGSEFGPDADFSPYYAPGIIAIDACTAYSKKMNIIVIEDDEVKNDAG